MASRVYTEDLKEQYEMAQAHENLRFIIDTLRTFSKYFSLSGMFHSQLMRELATIPAAAALVDTRPLGVEWGAPEVNINQDLDLGMIFDDMKLI